LFALASHRRPGITLEQVLDRATRVSSDVAARRERWQVETPWSALTRLIYDFFGMEFAEPMAELEMAFWKASATTRPMPGAQAALADLHRSGLAAAVVSNSLFGHDVIRYELGKHGLADHLAFVMVSAEYAVRKPNVLLFDTAAARLGVEPADIWFVGDRLDTDMAGARAAGMTAVQFRPPPGEQADGVDLTVTSWLELVERVQDARRA
jgi:HAD superfamily hydrolase (TIGR01509 family)